jgi:hypothetical protein
MVVLNKCYPSMKEVATSFARSELIKLRWEEGGDGDIKVIFEKQDGREMKK